MRRTPGLVLLMLVLALGIYFAIDPEHNGEPVVDHNRARAEEHVVTYPLGDVHPLDNAAPKAVPKVAPKRRRRRGNHAPEDNSAMVSIGRATGVFGVGWPLETEEQPPLAEEQPAETKRKLYLTAPAGDISNFTALPDDTSNLTATPDNSPAGAPRNETASQEDDQAAEYADLESDPSVQLPDVMHFEQYEEKFEPPQKVLRAVGLKDEQTSRQLLKEFARFKRFNVAAIESKQKKSFNDRPMDKVQRLKIKRQAKRAELAAALGREPTEWIAAIGNATGSSEKEKRPNTASQNEVTDKKKADAPAVVAEVKAPPAVPEQRRASSSIQRIDIHDEKWRAAISKEYGCKLAHGKCMNMAVQEKINEERLRLDEEELRREEEMRKNGEPGEAAKSLQFLIQSESTRPAALDGPRTEEISDGIRNLATVAPPRQGGRHQQTGPQNAEMNGRRNRSSPRAGSGAAPFATLGNESDPAVARTGSGLPGDRDPASWSSLVPPRPPEAGTGRGASPTRRGGGREAGNAASYTRTKMGVFPKGPGGAAGNIIMASGMKETPRSRMKCFDSHQCQGNDCPMGGQDPICAQQLKGSQKKKGVCDTVLQARTCVYENLYYDSEADEFQFYAPKGGDDLQLCPVMLRGYYLWQPRVVRELRSTSNLGEHNRTLQVDQIHHPCFAHAFLENTFMLYWSASEHFGRWDFNPGDVTRFIDGHLQRQHKRAENRFRRSYDQTGKVTDFYGRIQKLVARPEALFAGHQEFKRFSISRFHTVLVGGTGGRTIWTHNTYSKERPALRVDAEFSDQEKVTAFLNYFDHLARAEGYPSRSIRTPEEQKRADFIMLFNREGGARSISNAGAVLNSLKSAFGGRVYPKIVTPAEHKFPDIIGFMRKVAILITPHGAQIGNAGFMLPGSVLIEVQAKGCYQMAQDVKIANGDCYKHFARYAGLGYMNVQGSSGLGCSSQKQYPVGPNAVVNAVRKMLPAVNKQFDIRNELSRRTLRHLAAKGSSSPSWKHAAACAV